MKLLTLLPLLFAPLLSAQSIRFIRPEPSSSSDTERDFSTNPVYTIGTQRRIEWTETNQTISIVLYQERPGDNFEYVFQNSKDISDYTWNVGTRKNLRNGRVFFFQIFIQGQTSPTATSRYFNISDGTENAITTTRSSSSRTSLFTTSSTISSSASSSTTGTGVLASVTGSGTPSPTGSNVPTGDGGGGLSTGAKVGLGVGIPVAVIAIALVAFFLLRRSRKNKASPAELSTSDYTTNIPPNATVQQPHEKYSEPSAGEHVPSATQEQAGGYYKPVGSPNNAPSEMYTPPTQPQELPAQRYA